MSTEPSRELSPGPSREEGRTSPGRPALFALVVIGLTLAMLTLAGTTPRGIGRPVEDPSRVQLDQRTFSCAGGIDGATTRSGNLESGLAAPRTIPAEPITFVADRAVSAGAFAGQQAASDKSLAFVPCPEPRARWWFVAAGGAAVTHNTVLTLSNPRSGKATVDIDVFGPSGRVEAPEFRDVAVPAAGIRVINLARTAPANGDLAVRIVAKRGLVAVSAVDRFSPGTVGKATYEWLPPQSLPAGTSTLAGIPTQRGASTLVVANPTRVEAIVSVEVIGATGTFKPKDLVQFPVPPRSVKSVPLNAVIDGTPLALRITSAQRVSATVRSIKGGDTSFATGVRVIRGGTSFAVPDGSAQLVLSSLRTAEKMTVVAFSATGQELLNRSVDVAAQTSVPLSLPTGTKYVRLEGGRGALVAGFSVIGPHGTTAAGVEPADRSILLPKVRLGW